MGEGVEGEARLDDGVRLVARKDKKAGQRSKGESSGGKGRMVKVIRGKESISTQDEEALARVMKEN